MKLSQSTIDNMIKILALMIRNDATIKRVVGIANGGLHVSLPLSKLLNLPHYSVRISHYDGNCVRQQPIIEGCLPKATGNLIVDDLIDDGFTMRTFDLVFGLKGNKTAVLFCKPGNFKPNYYVLDKPKEWLIFPWNDENG